VSFAGMLAKRNVRIALNFVIQTSMFRPSTFPTFVLRFLLRNVHQVLSLSLYANVSSILSVNMVRHLQLIAEKCLQSSSLQPLLWLERCEKNSCGKKAKNKKWNSEKKTFHNSTKAIKEMGNS
jgi:hypothetical protein